MQYYGLMLLLSVKSLLGFGVAYEVAAAGRMLDALGIAAVGVVPLAWRVTKKIFGEPTQELAWIDDGNGSQS